MTLFTELYSPCENLLPYHNEGELYYLENVLSQEESQSWMQQLLSPEQGLPWQSDRLIIAGKEVYSRRQVSWHGDAPYRYRYSCTEKVAQPWSRDLLYLKERVEQALMRTLGGAHMSRPPPRFNSCLANHYQDGSVGMAWHSDNERELQPEAPIACLSLGATRTFALKHRSHTSHPSDKPLQRQIQLSSGSVLLMQGAIQQHWLHCIRPCAHTQSPRISLTFRCYAAPA